MYVSCVRCPPSPLAPPFRWNIWPFWHCSSPPSLFDETIFFDNDCKEDVILYLWLCYEKKKNPSPKPINRKSKTKPRNPKQTRLCKCVVFVSGGRGGKIHLSSGIWHHESFLKLHEMWICTFLCCVNASSALFSSAGFSFVSWGLNNFFYFFFLLRCCNHSNHFNCAWFSPSRQANKLIFRAIHR